MIPWEQLSADKYDKLVSILISQLNSRTPRIDGRSKGGTCPTEAGSPGSA
jgi:hypothetical protein